MAHKVGHVARLAHVSARMIDLIDMSPAAQDEGIPMGREEMFGVFGGLDPSEYGDEVEERWGETDAYQESARRTRRYAKEDWARFKAESDAVNADIAALMDEGVATGDVRAMAAAERHRLLIDAWFYPCSQEMHAQLGQMYVADPRFAATCERIHQGMAQYVCDAIIANAARAAGEAGLDQVSRLRQRQRHELVVDRLEPDTPVHGLGDGVVASDLDPQRTYPKLGADPAYLLEGGRAEADAARRQPHVEVVDDRREPAVLHGEHEGDDDVADCFVTLLDEPDPPEAGVGEQGREAVLGPCPVQRIAGLRVEVGHQVDEPWQIVSLGRSHPGSLSRCRPVGQVVLAHG